VASGCGLAFPGAHCAHLASALAPALAPASATSATSAASAAAAALLCCNSVLPPPVLLEMYRPGAHGVGGEAATAWKLEAYEA
jgi:hypothetical protein